MHFVSYLLQVDILELNLSLNLEFDGISLLWFIVIFKASHIGVLCLRCGLLCLDHCLRVQVVILSVHAFVPVVVDYSGVNDVLPLTLLA